MGSSTKKHKDKDKERDRGKEKEDKHKRKNRSKDRDRESVAAGNQDDDVVILEQGDNNNSGGKEHSRKRRHRDPSPEVTVVSSSSREKNASKRSDDAREERKSSSRKSREKRRYSSSGNDDTEVSPTKRSKGTPSKQARSPSPPPSGSGAGDASLSIAETNKLRIKLGLKPLQIDSGPPKRPPPQSNEDVNEAEAAGDIDEETANRIKAERELENETYWKEEKKDFVHAPATNLGKEKEAEKIRDKLNALRERRRIEEKLKSTKGLADDSDDEDSAAKWVERSKRIAEEKALAEKRAKALEELDDAFGVGDLVEGEFQKAKNRAYTDKHLKGMKVMHSESRITEGESVIMTLEDKDVLDEKDDVLINVNMVDDEKYEKNIEDRKMRPELHGYNVFEDLEFDPANQGKKVLAKYDEEIEGLKKKVFVIGEDTSEAARKAKIREQMQKANKILESVEAPTLRIASDFLTEEEMTFKKRTKKVRKVRKKLRADDLLMDNIQSSSSQDLGSRKRPTEGEETNIKTEPTDMEIDMEIDDLPAPAPTIDVSDIKLEDEGDLDFQLALSKARKLKQKEKAKKHTVEKLVQLVQSDQPQSSDALGDSMVLNATAEFCRTLGDIPSFSGSGGDLYADEAMDFETDAKSYREEIEERGKWNAVEIDEVAIDITSAPTELEKAPILEEEPEVGSGLAGALKLAMKKGFLEHEKKKRAPARTMKHLEAQNYSIDDKNYEEDRSKSKREMYSGPTTEFKEKGQYKPEVKLEYTDEEGRPISAKEAFRLLSHKFHGKGSGKNKIDKKRRKADQDKLMQHMSSTDTPLGTLELLQERQKATHSAYIVLSGSNKASQHALSKPSKR